MTASHRRSAVKEASYMVTDAKTSAFAVPPWSSAATCTVFGLGARCGAWNIALPGPAEAIVPSVALPPVIPLTIHALTAYLRDSPSRHMYRGPSLCIACSSRKHTMSDSACEVSLRTLAELGWICTSWSNDQSEK